MKRFKRLFVLLIMFVVLLNYANEGVFVQAEGKSYELLSEETDGEIPTANGDYAQIISYSAYVSYTDSSSAYYPDTSQKKDTLVKFGNPAKLTTTIPIRKKSNDSIVDTPKLVSKFYGTGKAE